MYDRFRQAYLGVRAVLFKAIMYVKVENLRTWGIIDIYDVSLKFAQIKDLNRRHQICFSWGCAQAYREGAFELEQDHRKSEGPSTSPL